EINSRLRAEEAERDRQEAEMRERSELEARIRSEIEAKLRAEDAERRREEDARRREEIAADETARVEAAPVGGHKANGGTSEAASADVREIAPWFEDEIEGQKEIGSSHQSIFPESFASDTDDNESEFRAVSVPDEPESFQMTSELQQALRSNSASTRASAVAELP